MQNRIYPPKKPGLLHEKLEAHQAKGEVPIFGVSSMLKRTKGGRGHFTHVTRARVAWNLPAFAELALLRRKQESLLENL